MPSIAQADPVVDQAVAQLDDLGLTTLTGMPSGRTKYRTFDEMAAEYGTLAAAYPGQVVVKTAPYKSIEGRTIKYLEITNHASAKGDGKPVFFNIGAIHGNETPAAEASIEFAYDVLITPGPIPRSRRCWTRCASSTCRSPTPTAMSATAAPAGAPLRDHGGVDLNRNYPFGWGSNLGVTFAARGSGPGSEPEVKNTMEIVQRNQVVSLLTQHTNSRAIFYPGLEIFAGQAPDLDNGYRDLALAMAHATNDGYTNVRDSAHDYETSGETVDWSYYATRGIATTLELVGSGRRLPAGAAGLPEVHHGRLHRHARPAVDRRPDRPLPEPPGPQRDLAEPDLRDARARARPDRGRGDPGATLKLTKDFNLYTAPIKQNTTPETTDPPRAIPTHLESSIVVGANGRFKWDVNPSVRPVPAYEADGVHPGPRGFYQESYTLTCTAADGSVLGSTKVLVDKGDMANVSPCRTAGVGAFALATFGAFPPANVPPRINW